MKTIDVMATTENPYKDILLLSFMSPFLLLLFLPLLRCSSHFGDMIKL